jgi:succinyl-diaminopimelate desuccinylase
MSIRATLIELTTSLVAIPSVSDDAVHRVAVIDFIEQFCRALPGVHVMRYDSNDFPSLVAAFDDVPAKSLILNGHVDVVPARPSQFEPAERDGKIYGRGAQDMKGAVAAMMVLLRDLAESGERPSVSWQFVTDEEIGGEDGVRYLLGQGYTADFFLAGEPTDLRIVNRAKGILWITITQEGEPAHGSRPWEGRNPVVPVSEGLQQLLQRYPIPAEPVWRTTVTPAAIHGGDAHNRVPDSVQLKLDVRRIPDEVPEDILHVVHECFPDAEVQVRHCGSVLNTTPNHPEVAKLKQAIEAETGQPAEFYNEHFGSDARFYSEVGIPAVCFGPVGAGLHSHEEWVSIDSLETFHQILRRLVNSYR